MQSELQSAPDHSENGEGEAPRWHRKTATALWLANTPVALGLAGTGWWLMRNDDRGRVATPHIGDAYGLLLVVLPALLFIVGGLWILFRRKHRWIFLVPVTTLAINAIALWLFWKAIPVLRYLLLPK